MASVIFLRGVNVGGHRTFRPSLLAKQLKVYDAVNIGAAGTIVIRKSVSKAKLRAELVRRLPFATEIMICDARDIIGAVSGDPFAGEPRHADTVLFISILGNRSESLPSMPITLPPSGEWLVKIIAVRDMFAFGLYRRHMKTIGYLGQIEKRLGVPTTTRNWNTVNAIMKILQAS